MKPATNYRRDINGLRAWAVIAVVCYHFKLPGFSGGFVGVDIFFVISGFLMTGIVSRGLLQQNFSLWSFYRTRALRILPSLLLVCVACLIAGYLVLFNNEYRALLKQSGYSLLFVANIYFNSTGDYFNNNSHDQILLHTWSLAIEWQFYLLLPLALLFSSRIRQGIASQITLLCLFAALSLAALMYMQAVEKNTFYPFITRSWELVIGGLLYFVCNKLQLNNQQRIMAFYAGFALIIAAITAVPATNWPNHLTAIPLLGTCLIIIAARQNDFFTANPIAQLLGNWSYAIYLWHWPLCVYLYLLTDQPTPLQTLIAISISIVLAAITHYTVENYFLNKDKQKANFYLLAIAYCSVIFGCFLAYQFVNFSARMDAATQAVLDSGKDRNPFIRSCSYRENSLQASAEIPCTLQAGALSDKPAELLILGDSHAAAIANQLSAATPLTPIKMYTAYACPPILGLASLDKNYSCPQILPNMLEQINQQHVEAPVVIYSRFNSYFEGTNETISPFNMDFNKLTIGGYVFNNTDYQSTLTQHLVSTLCSIAANHPVTVVLPTPELGVDPVKRIARDHLLKQVEPRYGITLESHQQRSKLALSALKQAQQQCGIHLFDPTSYLCQDGFCSANDDTRIRYFDDDHLSQYGASLFASELINALNLPINNK